MALDFIQEVLTDRAFRQEFLLNPQHWKGLDLTLDLNWQRVEFTDSNKENIPEAPGIYAFVISNRDSNVPVNGYIMYIGVAGYKIGSSRNLKIRFKEYIDEERRLKRPQVHAMLNFWKGYLDFHFVELSQDQHDLLEIEEKLCGALRPPCNQNDFDAEIKSIVKAVRL